MSGPLDGQVIAVRQILTRLGKRSGLSAERVRTTEIDVSPLLELPAIRAHARRTGVEPAEAVLPVVRDVARHLAPTDRLVVDAALALGLITAAEADTGRLYAGDLGERREYLSQAWAVLHTVLGAAPPPPAPSARTLRSAPERRAFTALAAALVGDPARDGRGYSPAWVSRQADEIAGRSGATGTVTVLGNAVVDHLYRVDGLPVAGGTASGRFERRLGGKGLNRAVAAARLGMSTRLLAAVGGDDAGSRLLALLEREGVDTSMMKIVGDADTDVAALIVTPGGGTSVISPKGDRIQFTARDLLDPEVAATLVSSDVVIMTLESPLPVVERALSILREAPRPPARILQAAPPHEQPAPLYQFLDGIEYVVGSTWQLSRLVSATRYTPEQALRVFDDETAPRLLALGVGTVCAIEGFSCRLRGSHGPADIPPPRLAVMEDAPGAHAAFCGALAHQWVRTGGEPDFHWICAAMAATQSFAGDVPDAMPTREAIDRIADPGPA
ncbi:PfkB family carbohydrate kinase [Nocardia sp. NPDC050697]|uniref:PfkB family carbohydrate kinase n=1 Tax=Nocardia sp. NPDC050697 TaxID=3155158 RepID=UPI0033E0E682